MPELSIRKAEYEELDTCGEVIRKSFLTVAEEFGLTAENCPTNGAFIKTERLIAEWGKGNLMYGLFLNDELIGFVELERNSQEVFFLEKLAVLPQYRHAGYGALLIEHARKTVSDMGGTKISITIIEENTILKDWYSRQGFVHTGTKIYPHLPFTVGFMEMKIKKVNC